MPDDKTANYLVQEYLFLQKTVEEFDGRSLTIKAWSVTFSAAGLGFAYQQHNKILLLVAAGSALVFWIVEAIWKYRQRAFYPRIFEIERWFKNHTKPKDSAPFQITTRWRSEFMHGTADWVYAKDKDPWWKAHAVPFFVGVMLPHIVIIIAGVALFFAWPPGADKAAMARVEISASHLGK